MIPSGIVFKIMLFSIQLSPLPFQTKAFKPNEKKCYGTECLSLCLWEEGCGHICSRRYIQTPYTFKMQGKHLFTLILCVCVCSLFFFLSFSTSQTYISDFHSAKTGHSISSGHSLPKHLPPKFTLFKNEIRVRFSCASLPAFQSEGISPACQENLCRCKITVAASSILYADVLLQLYFNPSSQPPPSSQLETDKKSKNIRQYIAYYKRFLLNYMNCNNKMS